MEQRQELLQWIDESVEKGCSLKQASEDMGISQRTIRRWKKNEQGDRRKGPAHSPGNKLSDDEEKKVIDICISPRFRDFSPRYIVPTLADEGTYVASEATFYRILKKHKMNSHRQRCKPKQKREPNTHRATAPNTVYSWDITYLKTLVKSVFFKAYVFIDVFSRKIVGAKVFHDETSLHAKEVLEQICHDENVNPENLVVHSDNGAPMKGGDILALMSTLGISPSFNRPSVSNDNAFSESLFRTMKYSTAYPTDGCFENIENAQIWLDKFVLWYNTQHKHSGIKYVTPQQRHNGEDIIILKKRKEVYAVAQSKNPIRWSKNFRNWDYQDAVTLNDRKKLKVAA